MPKRRALITGVAGQDGSYLAEWLLKKNYEVFGLVKSKNEDQQQISRGVHLLFGDLGNRRALKMAVIKSKPDEIYNLAGISDLKTAFRFPKKTLRINFDAVRWLLDESWRTNPKIRFLQASSSEIFRPSRKPLREQSARDEKTDNPYAKAKIKTDDFLKKCRQEKKIFACSAILFNHESPRRPDRFVTRKITSTLVKIKRGLADHLELGNLEAKRDWGFAGDYVEAMWLMLQQPRPQDFVIATGQLHSIKEFIETACQLLAIKINWTGEGVAQKGYSGQRVIIKINPQFYRLSEKYPKVGHIAKAQKILHWQPRMSFKQLVRSMVEADEKLFN